MKPFNVGYLSVNVGTEGRQAVEALAEFLHLMDAHFETMAKVRGCADLPDVLRDLCWVYLPDDPIHPSWSGLSASEVTSAPLSINCKGEGGGEGPLRCQEGRQRHLSSERRDR